MQHPIDTELNLINKGLPVIIYFFRKIIPLYPTRRYNAGKIQCVSLKLALYVLIRRSRNCTLGQLSDDYSSISMSFSPPSCL